MSKLELMLEAERRGILPPDKAGLLAEARKRGLVPALESSEPVDTPERQALKAKLDTDVAAADEAGKKLKTTEAVAGFVRPLLSGITVPIDAVAGLPAAATNMGIRGANRVLGTTIPTLQPLTTERLAPQTRGERYAARAAGAIAGAATGVGLGRQLATSAGPVTRAIGEAFSSNPVRQAVQATTGSAAAERAREGGAGPLGQTAAGVLGAIAQTAAASGFQAGVRAVFRGGEAGRQRVEQNVDTFARAGTTPSVGQATESRALRATEQVLSGLPGGAAPIARKAAGLADEIGAKIDDNATQLAGRTSAEQAGRKITAGIEGKGGFVERTKATETGLYQKLAALVPPATPSSVANTQNALKDLTRVNPGAARTTTSLINPKVQQIANDLAVDAQSGAIPYGALSALRTKVGEMLDDGLVADVPQKQLRRLYAALSDDMQTAASAAGPAAEKAWRRANNYSRTRADRLEVLDDVLQKNGGPEAVFKAATSGTAEGATKLRQVMQSLDDDGQKAITATVMRRLGRATPGQQDDVAGKFSTETFLTNFNRLSPEAKRSLFDRYGPGFRQDMDAIAKVAANLRDGSKVYANPAGTAPRVAAQTAAVGFITALGTGNLKVAAGIAAGVGSANLSARLLTNPNFVRFLADSTKVPASAAAVAAQLQALEELARETEDPDLQEGLELLKQSTPPVSQPTPARDLVRAAPGQPPVAAAPTSATRKIAEALAQQNEPQPGPTRDLALALYEAQRRGGR